MHTAPPLTAQEVKNWTPDALPPAGSSALQRARERMARAGEWHPGQVVGRRMSIACVALEITQRCNLDCSYCYLSESSEALKDIPMEEVLRRIDLIHAHYGEGTDVQVTGGDPTLRPRAELVQIVRAISARGMQPSLFTNGIKATRELLAELCEAGLVDVAFHVDTTQQRAGYADEAALNALRLEYIERARGLPLSVFFNTTVSRDNLADVPDLMRFFMRHCDVVRLAAFQVGADSGRGTERQRAAPDAAAVQAQIQAGLGIALTFDAAGAGPQRCNRYGAALILNGRAHDFMHDHSFVQTLLGETTSLRFDRRHKARMAATLGRFLLAHPRTLARVLRHMGMLAWRARADLWAVLWAKLWAKPWRDVGRIGKLSVHVHNFQDAQNLDRQRCEACSFMVMTPEGPLSMCVHNAKRDDYLLVPARVLREDKLMFWSPATGRLGDRKPERIDVALTRKNARGRARVGAAHADQAVS